RCAPAIVRPAPNGRDKRNGRRYGAHGRRARPGGGGGALAPAAADRRGQPAGADRRGTRPTGPRLSGRAGGPAPGGGGTGLRGLEPGTEEMNAAAVDVRVPAAAIGLVSHSPAARLLRSRGRWAELRGSSTSSPCEH